MRSALVLFATGLSPALAPAADPTNRPNVVVILSDDQGRGDYSAFGTKDVRTPHIDRLYEEGMAFDNFYANSPVCSPTRAALLTGCYPDRVGVPGVSRPAACSLVPPNRLAHDPVFVGSRRSGKIPQTDSTHVEDPEKIRAYTAEPDRGGCRRDEPCHSFNRARSRGRHRRARSAEGGSCDRDQRHRHQAGTETGRPTRTGAAQARGSQTRLRRPRRAGEEVERPGA